VDQAIPAGLKAHGKENKQKNDQYRAFFYPPYLDFILSGFKNGILIQKLTPFSVISVAVFNLLIILISKWLVPAFDAVLKVFAKVGSVIFGAISTIVFFLILTPIGLLLRLHGKQAIHKRYDKKCESYYEEWEPAGTIEKQF